MPRTLGSTFVCVVSFLLREWYSLLVCYFFLFLIWLVSLVRFPLFFRPICMFMMFLVHPFRVLCFSLLVFFCYDSHPVERRPTVPERGVVLLRNAGAGDRAG